LAVAPPGCDGHFPIAGVMQASRRRCELVHKRYPRAVANVISRARETHSDVEIFQTVALFCGAGLVASLLLLIGGLDLSAAF
jgi:hypothetical protein